MLDKLERKFGWLAIPNLPMLLVAGQAAAFVLMKAKPGFLNSLTLIPAKVMEGEIWRVVSWIFIPPSDSVIFIIFELLLLFMFGRGLEAHWGAFKFNAFFFIGVVLSVAAAFLVPWAPASNVFLMASLMLAFARLNPDFELLLFFILPVKIKWIGYLTWAGFGLAMVVGGWQQRAMVAAGVANYFVFFAGDILAFAKQKGRRTAWRNKALAPEGPVRHVCAECGITDRDDPNMQFRYCSKCTGKHGYCTAHLKEHEHRR